MKGLSLLPLIVSCLTLAMNGCALKRSEGSYYELDRINVIERDLGIFKSSQVVSTEKSIRTYQKPVSDVKQAYELKRGETYKSAIERWLKNEGYFQIAWGIRPENKSVLDIVVSEPKTFNKSLKQVLDELSEALDVPIYLTFDNKSKVAGVYDFNELPKLVHIKGQSLKTVVSSVVAHYGYKWDSSSKPSKSWLSQHDYQFGADYYLLTKEGDIQTALTIVLEGYPVYSSILDSTGQVFVQEEI